MYKPVSLSSFSSGGSEDFSRSSEDRIKRSGGKGFKESLGIVISSLGDTSTSVNENIWKITKKTNNSDFWKSIFMFFGFAYLFAF